MASINGYIKDEEEMDRLLLRNRQEEITDQEFNPECSLHTNLGGTLSFRRNWYVNYMAYDKPTWIIKPFIIGPSKLTIISITSEIPNMSVQDAEETIAYNYKAKCKGISKCQLFPRWFDDTLYVIVQGCQEAGIYTACSFFKNDYILAPIELKDFIYNVRSLLMGSFEGISKMTLVKYNKRRRRRHLRKWKKKLCPSLVKISEITEFAGLKIQSGIEMDEKQYRRSKTRTRRHNMKKIQNKLQQVDNELRDANLGSRRRKTKEKFRKKCKTQHVGIKPQAGFFDKCMKTTEDYKQIIVVIEKAIALFFVVYADKPIFKALSAAVLLFQGSLSETALMLVKDCIKIWEENAMTVSELSNWLKDACINFASFKKNKYAQAFCSFISKCFSFLMCPSIASQWDSFTNTTIVKKIMEFFESISNPMESIIHAFTYVVNGIDIFVRTGSMSGFLNTELTGDKLLEDLRRIRTDYLLWKAGDIEFVRKYKIFDYYYNMETFLKEAAEYRKSRRGPEQKVVDDWIREVDKYQIETVREDAKTANRIQPYMFILSSGSGISKTHLIKLMWETVARANGIPSGPKYTCWLNQSNKFQSTHKNYYTIMGNDDSGACIQGKDGCPEVMNLGNFALRAGGNAVHELLSADAALKGMMQDNTLIHGWTSNSWNQQFHKTMQYPSAVNRRFQLRIFGKVKGEFTKTVTFEDGVSTQIDYSKVPLDERNKIAPDAWLFSLHMCEIKDIGLLPPEEFGAPLEEPDNLMRFPVLEFKGKRMKDVTIHEVLEFMVADSKEHFKNQQKVLEMADKVVDDKEYCPHGLPICTRDKGFCFACNVYAKRVGTMWYCIKAKKKLRELRLEKHASIITRCIRKVICRKRIAILLKEREKKYPKEVSLKVVKGRRTIIFDEKAKVYKYYDIVQKKKDFSRCIMTKDHGNYHQPELVEVPPEPATAPPALLVLNLSDVSDVDCEDLSDLSAGCWYHKPHMNVGLKVQRGFDIDSVAPDDEIRRGLCTVLESWFGVPDPKVVEIGYGPTPINRPKENAELESFDLTVLFGEEEEAIPDLEEDGGEEAAFLDLYPQSGDIIPVMPDKVYHQIRQDDQTSRITYMKGLLETLQEASVLDIFPRMESLKDTIKLLGDIRRKLFTVLETWFDELIIDVIIHFVDKILGYVQKFLESPASFIPKYMEGTLLGAYAYAKHPLLRAPLLLDYIGYRWNFSAQYLVDKEKVVDVPTTTPLSDMIYNRFIKTKTKAEQSILDKFNPASPGEFFSGAGMKYSLLEKATKEQDPDFLRDLFIPIAGSGLVLSKFIPKFCSTLKEMYVVSQVGYEVPVEKIKDVDKEVADKWYLRAKEIYMDVPDVKGQLKHTDLESLLFKNTFYCKNMETLEFCTAFSPQNKYFLLPYHFVKSAIGKILQFTKREIDSITVPGNALLEVTVHESNIYKLKGDMCVFFVEQNMSHVRTKDLLAYMPEEKFSKDLMQGTVLYKSKLGCNNKMDAVDICYHERCNNENLGLLQTPKNPFIGYMYKCDNFPGLCGALVIDESHKKSQILGFHVGGNEDKRSVCQAISVKELREAFTHFEPYGMVKQVGVSLDGYGVSVPLKDPYVKNPFFDTVNRLDGVEVLGSIDKRITSKAKVVYTPICDDVLTSFKIKTKWGPAPFKFDGDKRHGVRSLIRQYSGRNILKHPELLIKAQKDYAIALLTPMRAEPEFWSKEVRVLTDYEVVNGIPGKKYVGGMNMSSSFDSRRPGPKSRYATQHADGHWEFEPFVMEEFHTRLKQMEEGIITNEIYTQCLKNEATPQHKIDVGKVRSFYMSGTVTQMIIRKYLLTTCRYYCFNAPYSETMVGINPHDESWDKFCREFYAKGKDYMMALDFKSFDLTTLFEVLSSSIKTVFAPLREAMKIRGDPPEEIIKVNNVLNCIAHLLLYSMVIVGGEVVILQAIIASGSNLTSILGSTVNSINYRMAFYHIFGAIDVAFRDAITLRTFGDDSLSNTTYKYKKFSAKNVLSSWHTLGIPATGIEKTPQTSKKFYRQNELEFLKRKMIYSKDFGSYIAPLSEASMFKCICCHIPSKTVSIEHLTGQCVDNFLFEARYHGRRYYNRAQSILRGLLKKHDLLKFSHAIDITYDDHIKNWRDMLSKEQVTSANHLGYLESMRHFLGTIFSPEQWSYPTPNFNTDENYVLDRSHEKTGVVLDDTQLVIQSGEEVSTEDEQIVTFVDVSETNMLSIGSAMPPARMHDPEVDIREFLARPQRVMEMGWGFSGVSNNSFDPWTLLLENTRISNKLATYYLFRGKCKVKFVINGNSFFYGKIMVVYLPFVGMDGVTPASPLNPQNRTPASQCPKVFLDPTLSEGAEISLPWFYHKEYYDLTDQLPLKESPGTLFVHVLNPLKNVSEDISVSGATVTITAYAWFEDIEMEGATTVNPQLIAPQSGREDETKKKPISQFCTAVANAGAAMSTVPVIGPYARAVEQGARVGSTVASALGYCKPVDVEENTKVVPRNQNNMALTNTVDDVVKFTLDAKQELSIDPRLVGLSGVDELSFQRIASIPTYVLTANWSTNDRYNDLIMQANVNPYHYVPVDARWSMSAMAGVAFHFEYWTGTIEFMFQVVASTFHRGRLLVTYDPNNGTTINVPETNAQYSWVVDIGETRDFKISVSNYQPYDWIRFDPIVRGGPQSVGRAPLLTGNACSNGVVRVYVLNNLTVPSQTVSVNTDVGINMFVNAGKDFKVAVPRQTGIKMQAGLEPVDPLGDTDPLPLSTPMNTLNNYKSVKYIGEEIDSFRTLLKRYYLYGIIGAELNCKLVTINHQMYPLPREPNGYIAGYTGNTNAAYTQEILMNLLMYAFSGYKGSVRWKIFVKNESKTLLTYGRHRTGTVNYNLSLNHPVDINEYIVRAVEYNESISSLGCNVLSTSMNEMLSFELPFYSNYSMIPGKQAYSDTFDHDYTRDGWRVCLQKLGTPAAEDVLFMYVAAGEDFTCFFFTGWPLVSFL